MCIRDSLITIGLRSEALWAESSRETPIESTQSTSDSSREARPTEVAREQGAHPRASRLTCATAFRMISRFPQLRFVNITFCSLMTYVAIPTDDICCDTNCLYYYY